MNEPPNPKISKEQHDMYLKAGDLLGKLILPQMTRVGNVYFVEAKGAQELK